MNPPTDAPPRPRAVIVLFHPDDAAVAAVAARSDEGLAPVVVVNAIAPSQAEMLRKLDVEVIENADNVGLARAFNQGLERVFASGSAYAILFDQDSRPPIGMALTLAGIADAFQAAGGQLACIGPVPVDRKRPNARTTARHERDTPSGVPDAESVRTIISSGMVIPQAAYAAVGGMWDDLFIDQIDHEWCFRARAVGLTVLLATTVTMPHDMGDAGFTLFGRYKPIHRSPIRHFYIVRNTLWLARCSFIPRGWRIVEMAKLVLRGPSYVFFSRSRRATVTALIRAIAAGLRSLPPKLCLPVA
ncbi:glycosyltransferase [Sphingomonas sp. CD22]|uniref:glycosyltransferase n=1 Tax=Sphingomonas sp. CD22 TaxID=3100214 RepID=UPI002AE02CF5|nr:glycosyltransferase [Sphingomonas sp. CD22]MEA1085876.1 glycosyltransferase [Sphingomonas sp. CD22]